MCPHDCQDKNPNLACKIFHDLNPPYLSRLTTLCTLTYCQFGKLTFFIFPYKHQLLSHPVPISPSGAILLTFPFQVRWHLSLKNHGNPMGNALLPSWLFSHLICNFTLSLSLSLSLSLDCHFWLSASLDPLTQEHSSWHTVNLLNVCWMASGKVQRDVFGNCGQNQNPLDMLNRV